MSFEVFVVFAIFSKCHCSVLFGGDLVFLPCQRGSSGQSLHCVINCFFRIHICMGDTDGKLPEIYAKALENYDMQAYPKPARRSPWYASTGSILRCVRMIAFESP